MTTAVQAPATNEHEHEHDSASVAQQPEGGYIQLANAASADGSIYARMVHVAAGAKAISKDGFNKHHGYHYVSKDSIFSALKPLLARAGLAIVPVIDDLQEITSEHNGKTQRMTRVRLTITVASEHAESLKFVWYGDGQDTGDKAVSKAVANGMKSWLINTFQIPAGDDDETPAAATDTEALRALQDQITTERHSASVAQQHAKAAQDRAKWLARISDLQSQASQHGINFVVLGQQGMPLGNYSAEELKDYGIALGDAIKLAQQHTETSEHAEAE
jgi:hypothetical protein